MQLRGAFVPNFQSTFGVSESLLGLLTPAGTIGFTAAALASGMLAGRINIRRSILFGVAVTSGFTFLIGFSPSFLMLLVLILIRGMFAGLPGGLSRPLLGHLYAEKRGQIFSINDAVWALGAAFGPIVATIVLNFYRWQTAYIILGFFFIPVFFLMAWPDISNISIQEKRLSPGSLWEMLKHPVLLYTLFALFLNVGVEGGFFTWLPYYLNQTMSHSIANISLSAYLMAYVPGRLLNSWLTRRFRYTSLALANSLVVLLSLIGAFFLTEGYTTVALVIVTGFAISAIFPNLFALAMEAFPHHSGPTNGLIMTFDPLGLSTVPAIMGLIADKFSIQIAMQFMILPLLGSFILMILLHFKTGNIIKNRG